MSVRFRILQIDDGAKHLLGFAKQQCNRLISTGLTAFNKTWTVGGATVSARSIDNPYLDEITVKLRLAGGADSGPNWYYGIQEAAPELRGLGIFIDSENTYVILSDGTVLLTAASTFDGQTPEHRGNYSMVYNWAGDDWVDLYDDGNFGTGFGYATPVQTNRQEFDIPVPDDVASPIPAYRVFPLIGNGGTPSDYVDPPALDGNWVDYVETFISSRFSANAFLESVTATYTIFFGYEQRDFVGTIFNTYGPEVEIDFGPVLGIGIGRSLITSIYTNFPITADKQGITVGPVIFTGNLIAAQNGSLRTFTSKTLREFCVDEGMEPSTDDNPDEYAYVREDWYLAGQVARVRERAQYKKHSDEFQALLRSGVVPRETHLAFINDHLSSDSPQISPPLKFTSVWTPTLITSDEKRFTHVVTLEYTTEDGVVHSQTINGSLTVVRTLHTYPGADKTPYPLTHSQPDSQFYSYTSTFTNWVFGFWDTIPPSATSGAVGYGNTTGSQNYGKPVEIGTGTIVEGRNSANLIPSYPASGISYGSIGAASQLFYDEFTPPIPESDNTLEYAVAELSQTHRQLFQPSFNATGTPANFTTSRLYDGEIIQVALLSYVHDDFGDLGMFPRDEDLDPVKLICRVNGVLEYKYDYKTDALILQREMPIYFGFPEKARVNSFDFYGVADFANLYPFAIRSKSTKYKDLFADYKAFYNEELRPPDTSALAPLLPGQIAAPDARLTFSFYALEECLKPS